MSLALLATACALEGTEDLPQDVAQFDPSQALDAARRYAGASSELLGFEARFVRSDGTMDLAAAYHPSLEYEFIRPNPEVEAAPVGTGVNDRAYEFIEVSMREPRWVNVKRFGGGCSGTFHDLGMRREVGYRGRSEFDRRTAAPRCTLSQVWTAVHKQKDVPPGAVAVIEFSGAGYEFSIADLDIELWFTPSCEPLTEDEFSAREADHRLSPEERKRVAQKRIDDAQIAQETEAARVQERAARDARMEQLRREALEGLRARKAKGP